MHKEFLNTLNFFLVTPSFLPCTATSTDLEIFELINNHVINVSPKVHEINYLI